MCKPAVFRLGMTAGGRSIARAAAKLLVALVALPVSMPAQAQTSDDSATYTVTFQGNWTTASTPDGVVGGAHFTTLIGAVHNAMVTFWAPGGTATTGVENVAELGSTSVPARTGSSASPGGPCSMPRRSGSHGSRSTCSRTTPEPRRAPSSPWATPRPRRGKPS